MRLCSAISAIICASIGQAAESPPDALCTYTAADETDRLSRITNNFGRWIQIDRQTGIDGVVRINQVSTSDGRVVAYNYSQYQPTGTFVLTSVIYPGAAEQATYTYTTSDPTLSAARPLISSATDPAYKVGAPGAQIKYVYNYNATYGFPALITGTLSEERNNVTNQSVVSFPLGGGSYPQILEGDGTEVTRKFTFGRLTTKRDGEGRETTFTRDTGGKGFVASKTDANGTTQYTRDYAGRVLSRVDALGKTRSHTYNVKGFMLSATNELNKTIAWTRDTVNSRLTRKDYPDGSFETWTNYNANSQAQSHRLRNGATETFVFDPSNGNMTSRTDAAGNTWTYTYYPTGLMSSMPDPLQHTESYTYNWRGQILTTTHPDNSTITYHYDEFGNRDSVTDELGHTTAYLFDEFNRLKSVTDPLNRITTYEYGKAPGCNSCSYAGTLTGVSRAGLVTTYSYDNSGLRTCQTVGAGTSEAATTTYEYDDRKNMFKMTDPRGKIWMYGYDDKHRRTSATDPLGNQTSWTYDDHGNKLTETRPDNGVTHFEYNAVNLLKKITDPAGNVTEFTYESGTNLKTIKDPKLNVYTFTYDNLNRKIGLAYPLGSSESWTYDDAGRNNTFTNRDGKVQTIVDDARNRATNVSWNDNEITPTVTYGYDAASRVTSISNANAAISRNYYNDNRLQDETTTYADNVARTVAYSYDNFGNRWTIDYPNNVYRFYHTYTARNQLRNLLSGNFNLLMTYNYDLNGNVTTRTSNNPTTSTYGYDDANRVTSISHAFSGSNTRTLAYGYDSVGNRKWTKRDGGSGDVFGYDPIDQSISVLLNVANPDTTASGPQTIFYDPNGNRTSFAPYGGTDTYATNNLNQYTSRTTSGVPTNFAYNANGSLTSVGSGGGQDLVSNAGLETGTLSPWTGTGNVSVQSFTNAHAGTKFAAFNAGNTTPNGVLTQSLSTTAGVNYTLSFWQGNFSYNQTATQKMKVTVKDGSGTTIVGPNTYSVTHNSGTSGGALWANFSLTFTATSGTTTIQFADDAANPTNSTDLLLDDVSVLPTSGNSITNPGFETGSLSPWTGMGNLSVQSFTNAHSGTKFVAFNDGNRTPNGILSQVINTTAGTTYTLSFWQGNFSYNQTATQKINITVKNSSGSTIVGPNNYALTHNSGTSGVSAWVNRTITFTATSSTTTIQFADDPTNPTNSTDLLLDDVSVTSAAGAGSSYTYDSQNRLVAATKDGVTETYTYDGINRQVSRKVGSAPVVYNVYDGWDLIAEYQSGSSIASTAYLFGAGELIKNLTNNSYYYQDALGSTSHLANSSGTLVEWYRYDLQGVPFFFDASNTPKSGTSYYVRHLFTGQQWYSGIGLYDLRNRFYSPDIGRFLQTDPLRFDADDLNLYRYVHNNPVNWTDPSGLNTQGSKVVCDGKGGFEIDIGGNQGSEVASCIKEHEMSHVEDLKREFPDGCKNRRKGDRPEGKRGMDQKAWEDASECKASKAEAECEKKLEKICRLRGNDPAKIEKARKQAEQRMKDTCN